MIVKKFNVFTKISEKDRPNWRLVVDAVYCADPSKSRNLSGEVLSKLLPVGTTGGFRIKGPREKPTFIVIYTSGEDIYWRDEVDNSLGVLLYYGDNRTPGIDLHETENGGNQILKTVFDFAASDDFDNRKQIPPVFVFKKYGSGRDMQFLGLAVPGLKGKAKKDWLTAVWGSNREGNRFLNYKAYFTILDTSKESDSPDASVNLAWITDLVSGLGYDSEYAPAVWKKYIKRGYYSPLMSKAERFSKTKEEQLPSSPEDIAMLEVIHSYFNERDRGYSFEPFANDIASAMDDAVVDIATTKPYKDGGYDGIGKYKLFKESQNEVLVDFYLQAKCNAANNPVTVKDTSRLISRIKDRQFGIMFTTSFVAKQAYDEILADGHPIIIITGINLISFLKKKFELFSAKDLLEWLKRNYS